VEGFEATFEPEPAFDATFEPEPREDLNKTEDLVTPPEVPTDVEGYGPQSAIDDDRESLSEQTDVDTIDMSDLGEPEASKPEPFEVATSDLFDLSRESDNDYTFASDNNQEFDSIAAADAIETDLETLSDFDEANFEAVDNQPFQDDNVIPLHPESRSGDEAAAPANVDSLRPNETGWISLGSAPADVVPSKDPWAYMRPDEEPKRRGFWASIFGGDERRQKRAKRRQEELQALESELGVYFDKACPECGSDCEVDFDDPVGRRVHASCPQCRHVWATPYIDREQQAG